MCAERDRQALRGWQEYDKIKHAKEKQAAAQQTFVFLACFNEKKRAAQQRAFEFTIKRKTGGCLVGALFRLKYIPKRG